MVSDPIYNCWLVGRDLPSLARTMVYLFNGFNGNNCHFSLTIPWAKCASVAHFIFIIRCISLVLVKCFSLAKCVWVRMFSLCFTAILTCNLACWRGRVVGIAVIPTGLVGCVTICDWAVCARMRFFCLNVGRGLWRHRILKEKKQLKWTGKMTDGPDVQAVMNTTKGGLGEKCNEMLTSPVTQLLGI